MNGFTHALQQYAFSNTLRFTINVCNNQSNSLHVQNEKETNNEAGNEHTSTTMLHEFILNDSLKKHSYPQLKTKSLILC